jgi:hypothetical protein
MNSYYFSKKIEIKKKLNKKIKKEKRKKIKKLKLNL